MLLHAGPPIAWALMCGPMQGAIVGAIILEGWAEDAAGARKLAESGKINTNPVHDYGAVGPMAGIISPSMPVWIVRDGEHGHRTFSNLNEGLGKALRFGANGPEVLTRLGWMAAKLRKVLAVALEVSGPIELKPLNRSGAPHGRRGAQQECRRHLAISQATGSGATQIEGQPLDVAEVVGFIAATITSS